MPNTKISADNAINQLVIVAAHKADSFNRVAFSFDGSTIVSGSDDSTIKLWDVASGKLIRSLEGHQHWVHSIAFSPDSSTIVSGSHDRTIKLWDVASGKLIRSLEGHSDSVLSIAFSPDGSTIVSGSRDKTIKLWDAASGKLIRSLEGHSDSVYSIAFSPDGSTIVSGSHDSTIKLWDVVNGKLIRSLEGHSHWVQSVAFSPDSSTIVSGSHDSTIKLWDVASGKLIRSLEGHNDSVLSAAFSPDSSSIVSGSDDKTIKLWDIASGKLIRSLEGHRHSVLSAAFSPDSSTIVSGSDDSTIKLWDVASGKLIRSLEGHSDSVLSAAFSPDGSTIVSGSHDRTIKLWDVASGKLIRLLEGHSDSVLSIAFSYDGSTIVSGSHDRTIKLWDVASGKLIRSLEEYRHPVLSAAFSPDGSTIASGSRDKTIKLWDVASGKLIRWLEGHSSSVLSIAFSYDGSTIVSGSRDKTIKAWNVASGKLIRSLEGHSHWVQSVTFSPDGHTLVSGSDDSTIKVWDIKTWTELATYQKIPFTHSLLTTAFVPVQQIADYFGQTAPGEPDIIAHLTAPVNATPPPKRVQSSYASAKIVLIGESNVGKSCLALRMAQGRYEEQGTTHGMQLWSMPPKQLSPDTPIPEDEDREVFIWDLGGQDEYRLVHQLFLHDTHLALFLFDPTRGHTAFEDVKEWNLRLEKQLRGRPTIKFLVGTKLDQTDATIDQEEIYRLIKSCGFRGYYSTSAKTASGIKELGEAISEAIDWDALSKTTRPKFFQCIHEVIQEHQQKGDVVLLYSELEEQMRQQEPEQFNSDALNTVIGQLAGQGTIVETRLASGERILALQIHYIEIYAGSLILAARDNPRGIPAIEELAVTQGKVELPKIKASERLDPIKERVMLECVVQLLIEHGICLRHEGLLIFPAMFKQFEPDEEVKAAHTVSLYYDFSGAIGNIWSSLVVRLAWSGRFGRVRMWKDRIEYDSPEQGVCGLQKNERKRGLAHLDLFFSQKTSKETQELFTIFVEDHLKKEGVTIKEVLEMNCPTCDYRFNEKLIRERIADNQNDIGCPKCDSRCFINKGAEKARNDNPKIQKEFFALKTIIERRRKEEVREAKQTFAEQEVSTIQNQSSNETPIRILHLSDLHWGEEVEGAKASVLSLMRDLRSDDLGAGQLDYLVVTGDLTNHATEKEFETALHFLSELRTRFKLSAERCIIVPGNHDLSWDVEVYDWQPKRKVKIDEKEAKKRGYITQGNGYLICNEELYSKRFENYAKFFKDFTQRDFILKPASQWLTSLFEETGIQFLMLNSAWRIDEYNPHRSDINFYALQNALYEADAKIEEFKEKKSFTDQVEVLRIAAFHHPATGNEKITQEEFLEHLRQEKISLCLHGHIHEDRADLVSYTHKRKIYAIGAGSFGANAEQRPESTPYLYNFLEVERDHSKVRVYTRHKKKKDGVWEAWYDWDNPEGAGKLPYYDILLKPKD